MAHFQASGRFGRHGQQDEDEEEEEEDFVSRDRVRRSYIRPASGQQRQHFETSTNAAWQPPASDGSPRPEPAVTRVTLDEGYFAPERRKLRGALANVRQKLAGLQLFNPARNESLKQQQREEWTEKEKYTLDCLNAIEGKLDERFQWNRPEDGREVWPSKLQYFLAITSYSIGLGNVIRFPILVQKNGGLAFIIPFAIMLMLEGIPLFYLELAIGQRMRKAAISCWNLVSPLAAGIGLASCAVAFLIGLYYNTMVAWTLLYLWGSLTRRPLPFAHCPSANSTGWAECQETGPFQFNWYRKTLQVSQGVESWAPVNWPVATCLTLAWLISFACLARGLSSSKRIVYVASSFPYVILVVFFFKALTLRGWTDGVYYLFAPEWPKLLDPYVWLQAAAQVFFSLGLGFGGLIALSSYNQVNNNCHRDAVRVSIINFLTSLFAGVVVFSILGFKAHLGHDQCRLEREQQINFYLADYNLKVLDYGAVFEQVPAGTDRLQPKLAEFMAEPGAEQPTREPNADVLADIQDDYSAEDALASINTLDRQLDLAASGGQFDYADSDTEFVINASNLISQRDLDKIIENIPNLPKCSLQSELDEASQGTGLVFVVIAEALSHFDDSTTWAIIFFLMLLALGFDSQFGNLEGLLSSVMDLNLVQGMSRQLLTGLICALSLAISVVSFAHGAGSYMFAIFDEYASSFSLVLIALFELLTVSYLYGLKRFCDDCELMTGRRPSLMIMLSWRYISPILLLVVTFATLKQFSLELSYEAWTGARLEYKAWPGWCVLLGALLVLGCVLWIPLVAVLRILKISPIPEENLQRCWFPAEELREFHRIEDEHKVTKWERILFGFRQDDEY